MYLVYAVHAISVLSRLTQFVDPNELTLTLFASFYFCFCHTETLTIIDMHGHLLVYMKYDSCRLYQESAYTIFSKSLDHTAAIPSIVLALYEAKALALANCTCHMLNQIHESFEAYTDKIKIILDKVVLE